MNVVTPQILSKEWNRDLSGRFGLAAYAMDELVTGFGLPTRYQVCFLAAISGL